MKRFAAILLLLALWPLPALAADFVAEVIGVSDGDTLTVLTQEKRQVKVRLHGIDAPETGQDIGSRAKQAASELALGKQLTVRELDGDRYGRTVAEVILPDGRSLNREMVRGGMGWWYRQYAPANLELAGLERRRRRRSGGCGPSPVPCRRGSGGAAGVSPLRRGSWGTARASSIMPQTAVVLPR